MPAQICPFSRVVAARVLPRSSLLRRLRRSVFPHHPHSGLRPAHPPQSSTVVALHARDSWMARRMLTVDRHGEIKRRLADGRSLREIANQRSEFPI
jgi:hypothetical protein